MFGGRRGKNQSPYTKRKPSSRRSKNTPYGFDPSENISQNF